MNKLTGNQRGIAAPLIIVVILLLVGVGGAAYFVMNRQSANKIVSNLTPAAREVNAACKEAYNDEDFCAFASNWDFEGAQKMTLTSSADQITTVYETDSNGNTRMVTSQAGAETAAFISIGKVSYIKNLEANNWTKYESETPDSESPASEIEDEIGFNTEDFKDDTSKITAQGKEACGNLNCFKYLITDTATPGEETTIWFDDKDYKLRRMTLKSADGSSDITFDYSVAAITEPSPVVEMPNYENMTEEQLQQLMEQYAQ